MTRRSLFWCLSIAWALLLLGLNLRAQAPSRPARPAAVSPLTASIQELMLTLVDPSADALFESVSYESTAAGVVEVKPRTNDDWLMLRRHAVLVAESANLLKMPGRRVAPVTPIPGHEGEAPGPEDLSPAEIQKLIDRDRATFNRLAQGLQDAARIALKAIDDRNVAALFESGEPLDQACESCHVRYWYPPNAKPDPAALSQRGKK